MSIRTNQQYLYNFISNQLNPNSYDVEFVTDLFNSKYTNFWYFTQDGERKRFVPTMISDIVGDYLNVPNANSTTNSVSIGFDIFVGMQDNSDARSEEFINVGYEDTINAIEEFKSKLLAQYFPLGDAILYFGGEDSTAYFQYGTPFTANNIKINLIPLNDDEETEDILTNDAGTFRVYKFYDTVDATSYIKLSLGDVSTAVTLEVPYTANVENEIVISNDGTNWTLENATQDVSSTIVDTFVLTESKYTLGNENGLEAKLLRLRIGSDSEYSQIDINTFDSKDSLTNNGEIQFTETQVSNCILWSENGNAIFSFGTLNPVSEIEPMDGGALYQRFELEMNVFISNDVLFGNNFEYYLDGLQIYPIDRGITLGTELGAGQYINNNENEYIVEESSRGHTMSFYYIPSKKLTRLLKHVSSDSTNQNSTYNLLVQYPFFQVEYDVVLHNGGTNPNINTLSTFTLEFKKADSNLVGG